MPVIERETYIKQIEPFIDKPFVKVLSGVRRCGKSSVMLLLKEALLKRKVSEKNIVYLNLESLSYNFLDGRSLYDFIKTKISNKKRYYILLDEIQDLPDWERAINSFMVDFRVDLYITGSNSRLLSSELSTFLAGRYIEIPIYTLSFFESLRFQKELFLTDAPKTTKGEKNPQKTLYESFESFLRFGGFPVIHTARYSQESAYKIIFDIYSSVILRDTVQRYKIRDIELLERVFKYVLDNIGNTFSAKNIADYFKSQKRKIDLNTVYNYLQGLEGAFVIYRTSRYDIQGKEILKTQEKFYLADPSIAYAVLGYRDRMISGMLENMLFLELKRRNYNVYVGKLGDKEIDFIGEKKNKKIYVQVVYKLESQKTIDREFAPLLSIKDHYPKYVVSMDDFFEDNIEGVRHVHLANFLLSKEY